MASVSRKNKERLPVKLVFQDEARFGRLYYSQSCRAPYPNRPMVKTCIIREYRYAYASICPWNGKLDYTIAEKMDTKNMNVFLKLLKNKYRDKFVVMVLDGASSHGSKDTILPKNFSLLKLPPYSPELNPAEQIWKVLRKKCFGNSIFKSLGEAMQKAKVGLSQMAKDKKGMIQLTNWTWIERLNKDRFQN
ncbi:MAG: IS630 family transposase [Deltaproteobacteria bacterium]|nr:IS630 family transposase [Deltaproteobacteria bacterium]